MLRWNKRIRGGYSVFTAIRPICRQCTSAIVASLPLAAGAAPDTSTTQVVPAAERASAAEVSELALQEVVVSAQHRLERLQDVPISAQVVSGETLAEQNLTTLIGVARLSPSVHVGTGARSNELYIRGIGSGVNQSFDQSVGIFVDDIYHGRSRMNDTAFFDLERAEILKGPQSTFFGNNAIAGAFNIVTRKPAKALEAQTRAFYAPDAEQYAFEGAIGGPITDRFGMRLAAIYNASDGWLENVATGRKQPEEKNYGARLTFDFTPNEDLAATLKLETSDNRSRSGFFLEVDQCPPPSPFVVAGFCGTLLGLGLPTGTDSDQNASSSGQRAFTRSDEGVLTLNYELSGHTLTSVTGYYAYDYDLNFDSDLTPLTLFNIKAPEQYHQFSQELRLASEAGQKVEYLFGAYYQSDRMAFQQDFSYYFLSPNIRGAAPLATLVPYLPLGQETNYAQSEDVYSLFGSLTWNVTDRLKLTGGMRGSQVRKRYAWNLFYGTAGDTYGAIAPLPAPVAALPSALGLGTPGALSGSRKDDSVMPSAKLQYQLTPSAMTYISYARGFKAGGFNGADNTGVAGNLPFDPEHVNAYELGLKSEWLNRRLLLNAAAFRSDYDNLQVAANIAIAAGTFLSVVRNAASSRSQGLELETQWLVGERFRLMANATYLHSRYLDYPNVTATSRQRRAGITFQDLSGKPTTYAPDWSGSVKGVYTATLPGSHRLLAELGGYFSTRFELSPTNDPDLQQAGYVRLDGRLSFESADGHWGVDLIGQNLNDRNIRVFASNLPLSLGSTIVQRVQPRNAAIQVRYNW